MKMTTWLSICKIQLVGLACASASAWGQASPSNHASETQHFFPSDIACTVQPYYRHRPDGTPGREVTIEFIGEKLQGQSQIEVLVNEKTEMTPFLPPANGGSETTVFLPAGVGVKQAAEVSMTVRQGDHSLTKVVTVPAMRLWTVYLYPHSHVDIGYTNTQANCEILHKQNIVEGIELAKASKDYPVGAAYRWNPEVTWPLERYWKDATADQREDIILAIQNGYLCVDASYLNLNTSLCNDEELFQVFRFSRELQTLTGVPMDSFQQVDIPGMSWGVVPVMVQQGVRYVMNWPNGCRAGHGHSIDEKPFWWVGPDGKSKVLFFQPGMYGNSGSMEKGGETGRPWFGQRDPDKVPAIIKTGSANVNFLNALSTRERPDNPYDFYVVSWSLWDNCPIDADIPDA